MFIQRSEMPQINQCIKVMYIEISEMCLKIISPLLKKNIAIHTDIELLSSPNEAQCVVLDFVND